MFINLLLEIRSVVSMELMQRIIQLVTEGKIDPYSEAALLLHALGKKIDTVSLVNLLLGSGQKIGPKEKESVKVAASLFNSFGFAKPVYDVFLAPVPVGYKNPLLEGASTYNQESLKTAITQYDIVLMLSQAVVMLGAFKEITENIEKELGPPKKSGGSFKQAAVDMLNNYQRREKVDPYLHAALICRGVGKCDSKTIGSVLKTAGVSADLKRCDTVCALVKKANVSELVKSQLAIVKAVG